MAARRLVRRAPSAARWREFWRNRRWAVLALAAAAAYLLGFVGWLLEGYDADSAAYYALQIFVLESPEVEDPNVVLACARFLSPIVAAGAAVQTFYTLFRAQLKLLGVRWFARRHVVVAGVGGIGFGLATAFREAGLTVVVVEREATNPALTGCAERGIAVITGDAADGSLLEKARLDRARYLFATCGDDGVNLDVVAAAARVDGLDDLTVLTHVRDLGLLRFVQAEVLGSKDLFPFRAEFFNVLDAGARMMLREHPPFSDALTRPPHVLFVGLESVGEFALLHTAELWRDVAGADAPPRMRATVVCPDARACVDRVLARDPHVESVCELEARDVELQDASFQRGQLAIDLAPIDCVYVCLESTASALSAALALGAQPALRRVPVVVVLWEEGLGAAGVIGRRDEGRQDVVGFPVLTSTLRPELLLLGVNESIARLRHEHYLRREAATGATRDTNPSLVPWDELPESLKESNRAFAHGIADKLAHSRCVLVPAPLANGHDVPWLLDESEVGEFARREHERWRIDLEAQGWQPTTGSKDAGRRLHPLLVDWEHLDEADRERDRDAIRALPDMLARAGFVIQRTDEAWPDDDRA